MSKVDKEKYPQVQQEYRFEKLQSPAWELNMVQETQEQQIPAQQTNVYVKQENEPEEKKLEQQSAEKVMEPENQEESALDPGLMKFLEADTYEAKLEILSMLHPRITDDMIDTMAVSLDIEVKSGDIEQRYSEILNCLLTMERFECNRLR